MNKNSEKLLRDFKYLRDTLRENYNAFLETLDTDDKKKEAIPSLRMNRNLYNEMTKDYETYIELLRNKKRLSEIECTSKERRSIKSALNSQINALEEKIYLSYSITPASILKRIKYRRNNGEVKAFSTIKGKFNESKETVKTKIESIKESIKAKRDSILRRKK